MKNLLLSLSILFLFSCGNSDKKVKHEPKPKPQKATLAQTNDITSSFRDKSLKIEHAATILSKDYDLVYFTAAKLSNGDIGVWCAAGNVLDPNLWLSVNYEAYKNSIFPMNLKRADMSKHGATEIYNYVDSISKIDN